jgi:uncharacterized membrane protein
MVGKLLSSLILVSGLLPGRLAFGQCQYEVTVIAGPECPPFGIPPTIGAGINEDGDVVGYYAACTLGPNQAFLWTADAGLVTLDIPGATESTAQDICGEWIVGYFNDPSDQFNNLALLRDGSDLIVIPPPEGTFSVAHAVNDLQGIVVGSTALGGFVWRDGELTTMGPFAPGAAQPMDVNDAGQVVGWAGSTAPSHPTARGFIWEEGAVTMLPAIPDGVTSAISAINNRGQAVGSGLVSPEDIVARPFLWTNEEMVSLGSLPGYDWCGAADINDHSAVIGNCTDDDETDATFLWQNGSIWNLNDLVQSETSVGVLRVWAMNNRGQITGWGLVPGASVALLLTPIDPPLGDLDIDCQVGVVDFLRLLSAWGLCPVDGDCRADLNEDGTVDQWDFQILIDNWG